MSCTTLCRFEFALCCCSSSHSMASGRAALSHSVPGGSSCAGWYGMACRLSSTCSPCCCSCTRTRACCHCNDCACNCHIRMSCSRPPRSIHCWCCVWLAICCWLRSTTCSSSCCMCAWLWCCISNACCRCSCCVCWCCHSITRSRWRNARSSCDICIIPCSRCACACRTCSPCKCWSCTGQHGSPCCPAPPMRGCCWFDHLQ